MNDLVGKLISHYRILEQIGQGGMGEVYLAEDTKLDRKVALKFLPPQYTEDPEINARFKREAKAAAALNHPNIITIHEIGQHNGKAFIVMEYVKGEGQESVPEADAYSRLGDSETGMKSLREAQELFPEQKFAIALAIAEHLIPLGQYDRADGQIKIIVENMKYILFLLA
jgi:aminoglycoside phosphotransferase (APT) family kinase protein